MNIITVAGNVARDAEVRYLPNGDAVANFSVADNAGKDKPAIFWNCQLFGKRAEALQQYIRKGDKITVAGSITERSWNDKDGTPRKTMQIRVSEVALQGGKQRDEDPTPAPQRSAAPRPPARAPATANGFDDIDSDITF
jgi:single-strand DNA-binding protein